MAAQVYMQSADEALALLLGHLREAQRRDPWAGHLVVVPSQRAADILALRLGEAGGAFGVEVTSLRALAGRLLGPERVEPLSASVRLAAMQAIVARGDWTAVASPTLAATLIALRDELATAGATPDEARAAGAVGERAYRALRAFDAATGAAPHPPDVLRRAARRLRSGQAAAPAHLDVWAFTAVTGAEAALLAACVLACDVGAYLPASGAGVPEPASAARLRRALGAAQARGGGARAAADLVAVANPGAQADAAARLVATLALQGTMPHRIACVGPASDLGRVAERLSSLGLAVRLRPAPLCDGAAGTLLARLLEAWTDARVESVLALLAGPGDGEDAAKASALADRLLRTPGATARERIRTVADDDRAGDAQEMAVLVRACLGALDDAATWTRWAEAVADAMDALGGQALDEREAAAVRSALDRIAALDATGTAPTPDLAAACLAVELSAPLPPAPLTSAPVELLAFEEAGAMAADAVVLFGVAAEDVAVTAADASLLAEEGRALLARGGWPVDGPDDTALSRLYAAAACRSGAGRVAAVYVAQGRTGTRPPADFLAPVVVAPTPDLALDWLESRRRLAHARRVDAPVWTAVAASDGALAPAARALLAAASRLPTVYDGQISPPLPPPPEAGWSPSLLEAYGRCPYQDFLSRLLHVGEDEEQDAMDDAEPTAADIGHAAHAALERLRREARSEGREPLTLADVFWVKARLDEALDEAFAALPPTPLTPVHRQTLLGELAHAVLLGIHRGDLRTIDSEWRFGPDGDGPLVLTLEGGRELSVRGRIDRIAEGRSDGGGAPALWVIDYKSGKKLPRPDIAADNLQLPLYMLAAARAWHREASEVNGAYVSVTARGGFGTTEFSGADLARRHADLDRTLNAVLDGMQQGRFGPRPNRGEHCRTCAFRPVCPGDVVRRAERKGLDRAVGEAQGGDGA